MFIIELFQTNILDVGIHKENTMSVISLERFYDEVIDVIDVCCDKELENIQKAAKICSDSIKNGGVVHLFGSGHSIGFGLEMQKRAGSLVPIHNMDMKDFVLKKKVTLKEFKDPDNTFERRAGVADKLFNLYDVKKEDCFIIISNSGINGVVIDVALIAKERGHKVVVVTSWQHTSSEDSRHPSGKKLYELGDVVIDNCGPKGDALIQTEGVAKICSISSITGAMIAQSLTVEIADNLVKENVEVPMLLVEDSEEAKKHNETLLEKYKGRL